MQMKNDCFSKFLTCVAIALAVFFGINNQIELWKNIVICIGIVAFLLSIFILLEHISNQDGNLIGWIQYISTRDRSKDYSIIGREVTLEFKNNTEATYTSNTHLKMKRTLTDFVYSSRYNWAKQSKDIKTEPIKPTESLITKIEHIRNWTYLNIKHDGTLQKGDIWDTGFKLSDLQITDYEQQSFLCFKVTEKVKSIKLTAKLPKKKYANKTATFYIWDSNDQTIEKGKTILKYDSNLGGFSCKIDYPKLGRSYVIDWD